MALPSEGSDTASIGRGALPARLESLIGQRIGVGVYAASAVLVSMLLWLTGRPLSTPDLWFHLKAGETYLHEGLWPKQDPMLFTGLETGPVQHEWLFGVFAHLLERALGFQGLRVTQVALVLCTLALFTCLLRRASQSWIAASLGCAVLGVLVTARFVQFRPDLWSIPAAMLLSLWVLTPALPRVRSCALAAGLFCVWTNAHSLCAIGLALVAACIVGVALELGILSTALAAAADVRAAARARLARLSLALLGLVLAGMCNPRGPHQLLTFFESSANTAVWEIPDEWTPFNPFSAETGVVAGNLPWVTADALLLMFFVCVLVRVRALRRERTLTELARFDPPAFMVAVAGCGAILISVRFLWLGFLPLIYCFRAIGPAWSRPQVQLAGLAVVVALCVAYPTRFGFAGPFADGPSDLAGYLHSPLNRDVVADEGVQFLKAIEAEGRIFNPYELGGYLGYRLAPRLRTFIDSRTEHYSAQVFQEWRAITRAVATPDGRDYLRALDDRRVDFFFGLGRPGYSYDVPYTLAHLENKPGWILVFRNAGQAIYMRLRESNGGNAQRIQQYYARLGIAFMPERGLDVAEVINKRLDWAVQQRMVSRRLPEVERRALQGSPTARAAASVELADMLFVAGAFRGAAHVAEQSLANAPDPARALKIALNALRRAGKDVAARALLARVREQHGSEPWLHRFDGLTL